MGITAGQKMKNRRAKLKAAGLCVTCGRRKPRKERVTCKQCSEDAKAAMKRHRESIK